MRKRWLALGVVLLLAILPVVARAEVPSLKRKLVGEVLVPLQPENLSGRSWLVASRQDPAFSLGPGGPGEDAGGPRFQAAGAAGAALIPYRDPSAKFSRNLLLSRDLGRLPFQTEPHLAVNPKDPNHLAVGLIDYNFPGISTYVSIDGGATWDGPFQPRFPRSHQGAAGDPTLAFDRTGTLYAAQIALDVQEFRIGSLVSFALTSNASVTPSADGGFAWGEPISASASQVLSRTLPTAPGERERGEVEVDFVDKPWMAIGPHWEKPGQDVIYVTYTNFQDRWNLIWADELPVLNLAEERVGIEMVRSEDGGQTWSQPVDVSPRIRFLLGEGASRRVVQGAQPLVAPDGTLYIAWVDSTDDGLFEGRGEIWVASSRDGGRTFATSRVAASFSEVGFQSRTSSFRVWATTFPQVAVGPQGEVYITYTGRPPENPEDDGDVFLVRSTDGGRTWDRPRRVNDDASGRLQFFPSVDVDPSGNLHMMWADTRDDPRELSYHIYYSSSQDGGQTWEQNSRVSDFPSNPNYAFSRGAFIGDYFSIKATGADVYMVWADSRLGQLGGINQKIGFARKRLLPASNIFLSPPSGPGGRDVVIQGFDFQPQSEVFVEMGGVILATGRAQDDGGFSMRLFVPIAGEGASSVRVMDSSGNVATASFFTEFGFDSFQKAITRLEGQIEQLAEPPPPAPSPTPAGKSGDLPWGLGWPVAALVALAAGLAIGALGAVALSRGRRQ